MLSFASSKRSGSASAKDSLKGKAAVSSAESPVIAPIRIGGKRKYEPDPEPEPEQAKEATEVLERESLDTEDPRWNKAFGMAREKMGNLQPGSSCALSSMVFLANRGRCLCTVHAEDQTPVHHILRIFDLYVTDPTAVTGLKSNTGYVRVLLSRSYEYGPCIGVTRLERWERAAALGLNPPSAASPSLSQSFSEERCSPLVLLFSFVGP